MIDPADLALLDRRYLEACATGDDAALTVLGYGEISVVLGWPAEDPALACKRLPPFPDGAALAAYASVLDRYRDALDAAAVPVQPTELHALATDGEIHAFLVQPAVPRHGLAPAVLAATPPHDGHPLVTAVIDATCAAVSDRVGFDGQISNWAWRDGVLRYLDLTTPLLRSPGAVTDVDTSIFLASYPWAMRSGLRRFVVPEIVARYHDVRSVLSDLAANLIKERLAAWIPVVLAEANTRLARPLTEAEVRADYRSDARMWATMQRIRRLDRAWQRMARRRTYPFLLPEIER
jgi:hypothetical protein